MDDVRPTLSVVIPIHDEAPNIDLLAGEIEAALGSLPSWECIWVDDGSTDGSRSRLEALSRREPRHRVLAFQTRRGQTAACLDGLGAGRGEFVGGLDGDGQNDPADLPRLLDHLRRTGLDMVNGVRARRRDSPFRLFASRIANGFRNAVTGDRITDVGCSLRVFRRSYVEDLPRFRGMHRFLPTFVRLAGGRIGEMPVNHRARTAGRTKYGIHDRLWSGLADTLAVRWMTRRWIRRGPPDQGESPASSGRRIPSE